MVFALCIYQHVHSESTDKTKVDHQNKVLEKLEEQNEKEHKTEMPDVYSSPKANEFLSYDKCIQRMKCPASRKEECREECEEGNTEEEVEEHKEITMKERRSALNKKPKPKFDTNAKKRSNKKPSTDLNDQSTIKTDL